MFSFFFVDDITPRGVSVSHNRLITKKPREQTYFFSEKIFDGRGDNDEERTQVSVVRRWRLCSVCFRG